MNTKHFIDPYKQRVFKESNESMNPAWSSIYKNLPLCELKIMNNKTDKTFKIVVSGMLKGKYLLASATQNLILHYIAPNSATMNTSFSGSGLPYPNEHVAFENSENEGIVEIINGKFSFSLKMPNSYYTDLGTVIVSPQVKIRVCSKNSLRPVSDVQIINLGESIPFRTLTYPNQRNYINGPYFYTNKKMPVVRSQYEILMSSAYPTDMKTPDNFWGLKPPK